MRRDVALMLGIATLLATITSCFPLVVRQRYPKRWPDLDEPGKESCARVEGDYRDEGESGHKKPKPRSLATLLFGEGSDLTPEHVRFEQPDEDILEISAWRLSSRR